MTEKKYEIYRFITATSIFDGHDASIQIIRRFLHNKGVEVIHLGHNRSAKEIVSAAVQEDVHAIAISSYQGGHVEYLTYILNLLKRFSLQNIAIFSGGGGVITLKEKFFLESIGVSKIFTPQDGLSLGFEGMINTMLNLCKSKYNVDVLEDTKLIKKFRSSRLIKHMIIAYLISIIEKNLNLHHFKKIKSSILNTYDTCFLNKNVPVLGFTGTGGAGKSSLIDELIWRFLKAFPKYEIAVVSIDPTRKKTGGALLADRIRINSLINDRVFFRSMATRMTAVSTNISINKILDILKIMNFDSIILETAGIGQGDIEISYFADIIIYVMTSEYGSSLQLEKIAILDYANYIVLNKADKVGAKDAFLDIQRTYRNIHKNFSTNSLQLPVFFTNTRHLNNPEINRLFYSIFKYLKAKQFKEYLWVAPLYVNHLSLLYSSNYLKYTVDIVRNYKKNIKNSLKSVALVNSYYNIIKNNYFSMNSKILKVIYKNYQNLLNLVNKKDKKIIQNYLSLKQKYSVDKQYYKVRSNTIVIKNYIKTISDLKIPKVIVPEFSNWDNIVNFFKTENLPGFFPYTSGVFPFKRESETTTRMFAGEGMPERTNKRFHYLSENQSFARLSTAFDSVTLYGSNPSDQLDIYGKIGNSGVSVCSLDDMKRLYSGFDLCNPNTSVSMTINGPAVILLGFFLNTAVDFECERYLRKKGQWKYADIKIKKWFLRNNLMRSEYRYALPPSHNSLGLGFLGLSSDNIVTKKIYNKIKKYVFQNIRGTMQADIFKEDQAQNTCIFSIEFSLRLMADIQRFFIDKDVKNFYSVSLSGYHIAEAGANPLTQLAFTLSNGFTLAEYYISSGLHINKFVKNFSFFFSNGLDIEYNVIGRVARRIWAISMKYLYNVDSRGQKLKYHIQTSGRSLHTKDIDFNDIRTTLQAYTAIADNCNSLHTNAYDEALTTPTEESVRRAIAIQLIINKEFGFAGSQNSLQGSYIIEWLTNKVEERVLDIFTALSERNGVLGAMDLLYQRNKIQEESMKYEYYKYTGKSSIVGINTFINKQKVEVKGQIIRSSNLEKKLQVKQVKMLNSRMSNLQKKLINNLKNSIVNNKDVFSCIFEVSKYCSLGVITQALRQVGGYYRRNI